MPIVLWLALVPAITAVLAGLRNRNVVAWYLIGIVAPVLGAVIVLLLPRRHLSPTIVDDVVHA
jgi:drug/metabolite transporter (DMT)-like permease